MGDYARGRLDLDDEERLPWLEPAIEDEEEQGLSPLRLLGFILFGLVLIGAVVAVVWLIQNRTGGAGGEGKLLLPEHDLRPVRVHRIDLAHRPAVEGLGEDHVEQADDFHGAHGGVRAPGFL